MINDFPTSTAHIDADHFYVNCELARKPYLRGRPVMVLGKLGSCILAKSPEAKSAGITTAMPVWEAKKICPDAVYLEGDFRYYTQISRQLMSLLAKWSPVIEVYSVDEAFIDISGLRGMYRMSYEKIADSIRRDVRGHIGITVSVGLSVNKTLAKMACESNKPDGTTVIRSRGIGRFLAGMPVSDIPGIGNSRTALLEKYNIRTAYELSRLPQDTINRFFGSAGVFIWRELRGERSFPVRKDPPPPKSIARTSSFSKPLTDIRPVHGMAMFHLERAIEALCRHNMLAGGFALYLRDKDFEIYHAEHRFTHPTDNFYELSGALAKLVDRVPSGRIWRSAGAVLTRLTPSVGLQLNLFEDPMKTVRAGNVNKAKLSLNARYGRTAVSSGATLFINEKCASHPRMALPLIEKI